MYRLTTLPTFLVFMVSAHAATAADITLERQADCIAEFGSASALLKYERASGRDITFAQIEEMDAYSMTASYNYGNQISSFNANEQQRDLELLTSVMETRIKGAIRQIKTDGFDTALAVLEARTQRCLSELGHLARERLS